LQTIGTIDDDRACNTTIPSQFYRKDRQARQEHRKGHRIFDPSHHRCDSSSRVAAGRDL